MNDKCHNCGKDREVVSMPMGFLDQLMCAECYKELCDSSDFSDFQSVFDPDDYERMTNDDRN